MITPAADNLPTVGQRGDEVQAFDCVDTVEQLELSAWQELSKKLKTCFRFESRTPGRREQGARDGAAEAESCAGVAKAAEAGHALGVLLGRRKQM